jgi:hypothetical protein
MSLNLTTATHRRRAARDIAAVIFSAALTGCGGGSRSPAAPTPPSPPPPTTASVTVNATDTFSGNTLSVDFTLEGCGQRLTGRTGAATIQATPCARSVIRVNMTSDNQMSDDDYVPSIYDDLNISGSFELTTDLPRSAILFGAIEPKWTIEVYRGRRNAGLNQVWRTQPETWIVSDPNGILGGGEPKLSSHFNNIMTGFAAVEDYTRGFIRAPPRESVEITTSRLGASGGQFVFTVNAGQEGPGAGSQIFDDVIVASFSRSRTESFTLGNLTGEMISSVQGGENESDSYINNGFRSRPINALDRIWGEFNYWKRKPGDKILPSGDNTPSPFGFPVEFRKR